MTSIRVNWDRPGRTEYERGTLYQFMFDSSLAKVVGIVRADGEGAFQKIEMTRLRYIEE